MLGIEKARKFMNVAANIGTTFSKDRSTKTGALITTKDGSPLSWGYNGMPRKVDDNKEDRHTRPRKYLFFEHAERNAIYNACREGIKLLDSRLFITQLVPCPDCTRAIIQSGIKEVYIETTAFGETESAVRWLEHWEESHEMLREAGVSIMIVPTDSQIDNINRSGLSNVLIKTIRRLGKFATTHIKQGETHELQ